MSKSIVSIVRYEKLAESVKKAVELSCGLDNLPLNARVFIKPNIVFWTRQTVFPKWGVITTSRVVEDMVALLAERGINDITIGEGSVHMKPGDTKTPAHAFEYLGYGNLKKRYGIKYINVFERPFEKVNLGDGVTLNFNTDIMQSDLVVDLPVLKTHAQTVVSLGIKNLKGTIDIPSRKKCHSTDPVKDLHFMVSKLANKMPPIFTLIDGIYTNELGPSYDGRLRRSNILVASKDILSADMVGAGLLGYKPTEVPYLVHAAREHGRPMDLSDIEVVGESMESAASFHKYAFPYTDDGSLPLPLEKMGIRGLSYKKYDLTLCTYCSIMNGALLTAIAKAWDGKPWDDVEILTGKIMKPTPGKKKTILLGQCIYDANKNNPDIQEMIPIKGCPPQSKTVVKALHQAGIDIDPAVFENIEKLPGVLMKRYKNNPDFDESFFKVEL